MGAFEDFVNTELPLRVSIAASPGEVAYPRLTGVGRALEALSAAAFRAAVAVQPAMPRVVVMKIPSPAAAEEYEFLGMPIAGTMTRVRHKTSAGTVDFNVNKRTTFGVSGTDVWSAAKGASTSQTSESSFDSAAVAADTILAVVFSNPSSVGDVYLEVSVTPT
jgi:hypothetical protein